MLSHQLQTIPIT
jgi:transposase InsO family protein